MTDALVLKRIKEVVDAQQALLQRVSALNAKITELGSPFKALEKVKAIASQVKKRNSLSGSDRLRYSNMSLRVAR